MLLSEMVAAFNAQILSTKFCMLLPIVDNHPDPMQALPYMRNTGKILLA